MTAPMTPDEARLRQLDNSVEIMREFVECLHDYEIDAIDVVEEYERDDLAKHLRIVLDALSAERERGDRALEIVMAIKDGPLIECIPDNDIQDMIHSFLSEEDSRHG